MSREKTTISTNWIGRVVPITNRPAYELGRFVVALNGTFRGHTWEPVLGREDEVIQARRFDETPSFLRKLVLAWQSSGRDLAMFAVQHRQMSADLNRQFENTRKHILLVCAPGGGAGIGLGGFPERDSYSEALRIFLEFLLNPECNKLEGPCDRCRNYYIRKNLKNRRYCSRPCATRATAVAATKKRQLEERADKLNRAAKLAELWTKKRTDLDWKHWVHLADSDIKPKFLTRAVNKGELKEPVRQRKGRKIDLSAWQHVVVRI